MTGRPASIGAALASAATRLRASGVEEGRLAAELLLAHQLGVRRLDLLLEAERPLAAGEAAALAERTRRRAAGEPVQYILGEAAFGELTLRIGPGVLIPRPETECLVEEVLLRLRGSGVTAPRLLDVGTGSGAVALALLHELPRATAVAIDVSGAALACAAANAQALGVSARLELREGDLLAPLDPGERFDAVVANLPYVSAGELSALPKEVRDFEPAEALLGGVAGHELIERLVRDVAPRLVAGGLLACEAAPHQAAALRRLVAGTPGLRYLSAFHDLSGRARGFLARATSRRP